MIINLDLINIFLLIVAVFTFCLGLVVYMADRKNKINIYFFIFTIAATLWTTGMFFARNFAGTEYALSFIRILYVTAITIPFAFIFFISVFPEEKFNLNKKYDLLLILPFLIAIYITVNPSLLIIDAYKPGLNQEQIIVFNRSLHLLYAGYIISYFSICYAMLFVKYMKFVGVLKEQIVYVIVGTFVSTIIGVSTNLIMPILGDFRLNWLGQIGIIFMIISISYSILKHHLFNLKIIATQFIVFLLCISLFIRFLLSSSQNDFVVNSIYLILSVVIGILLIRSVMVEVKQKEQVEILAQNLQKSNSDLELANNKLKELDQLKSEFLSLATHQIRAPLTAIKGYASLVLEGDYGQISSQVEGAVKNIFESCQNLVLIVGDFLDISRIEQGRMKYEMSDFDINSLISDIIEKLRPNVESAGLSISLNSPKEKLLVYLDQNKIRQVISNIIDNSIKYTKSGSITVSIEKDGLDVLISVKDTGIGISKEDIPKLFAKFVRAKDASKTNVIGTGLGLYIAKQMVEAQAGKVWVSSEGLYKGSTFYIRLPLKK